MSRLLSCVVLAALACGCDKPSEEVPAPTPAPKLDRAGAPPKGDDQPTREPKFSDEATLPEADAPADEKTVHFVARVTCDDKGKIEKITLRGDGIEKELDFKADVGAFAKKLKELVAKNNDKHLKLTLELADKLLQDYVVQLVDTSIRAGIKDVSPVPIDKSKR